MNKKSWITAILNNTISDEKIMGLIEKSYSYTVANKNCAKNEWIVPANPKYFDIEKALKENNTIMWKQSTDRNQRYMPLALSKYINSKL